ncbi:MAG TPA: multicopper oxidase domain-containing protein [Polyangiaceae bacterium]|nr:multicopper oxidase domain-containing protein [Polyangiaceae bacterium]
MVTRREWILTGAALAGTTATLRAQDAAAAQVSGNWERSYSGEAQEPHSMPAQPGRDYQPVITPNGAALPWKIVDGVKVFHLIAEEVLHEFTPGLSVKCWGYNGSVHGPTIEAVEGDRVRIYVTNRLAASTTVHWHGVYLPNGMDGVGGLNQPAIKPGETFKYEWTFRQHGTFMYHSHHDEMTQMAMGLTGMIVVHPRHPQATYRVDRDFVIMLSEWRIKPGTMRPDPNEMTDFNVLTMNARVFPGTAPLICKTGDRVRIRFGNLSAMDHHPIHLHGYHFKVTATDGGDIPPSAQYGETTVLVPTGSTRTVELITDVPGDWAMHCHMTHHVMNQMGHGVPNMIGVQAQGIDESVRPLLPGYMTMGQTGMGDMGDMSMPGPKNSIATAVFKGPHDVITMGGMFTIVKVRDHLESYDKDPGWYQNPPGTSAATAHPDDLSRDGISVPAAAPAPAPSTPASSEPSVQLYTCPMHPQIIRNKPGKCPICGMTLVPLKPKSPGSKQ